MIFVFIIGAVLIFFGTCILILIPDMLGESNHFSIDLLGLIFVMGGAWLCGCG